MAWGIFLMEIIDNNVFIIINLYVKNHRLYCNVIVLQWIYYIYFKTYESIGLILRMQTGNKKIIIHYILEYNYKLFSKKLFENYCFKMYRVQM